MIFRNFEEVFVASALDRLIYLALLLIRLSFRKHNLVVFVS